MPPPPTLLVVQLVSPDTFPMVPTDVLPVPPVVLLVLMLLPQIPVQFVPPVTTLRQLFVLHAPLPSPTVLNVILLVPLVLPVVLVTT